MTNNCKKFHFSPKKKPTKKAYREALTPKSDTIIRKTEFLKKLQKLE